MENQILNDVSKIFSTRNFLQAKKEYFSFMQSLSTDEMEVVKDVIKYRYIPNQQMELQKIEKQFKNAFGFVAHYKTKIEFINQLINEKIEPIAITEKGIPSPYTKEELMRIFDVMHNKGWMQGDREHFAAIFSEKPLIECNGWKPVTYCKTSRKAGDKANDAFIGALVAALSPIEPNKIISPNLFQFNGKPLEIGRNNRQTKTAEGEVDDVLSDAKVKKR